MKKTPIILSLLLLTSAANADHRVPLHGTADPDLPEHVITNADLQPGSYRLANRTGQTIAVFIVEGRTPVQFFIILGGDQVEFRVERPSSLDLFLRGNADAKLNGSRGVWLFSEDLEWIN